MLTKLVIRNFQGWGELSLELAPLNTITGPSGYGKSAILRAIGSIADPRPGIVDTKHGAIKTQVLIEIETPQGLCRILRTKSATINRYDVATSNGNTIHDKTGRTAPEQVLTILGWHEIDTGDGGKHRPQVSEQFDPPYLIALPPSQAARLLMAVTGVDRAIAAQKTLASEARTLSTEERTHRDSATAALSDQMVTTAKKTIQGWLVARRTKNLLVKAVEQLEALPDPKPTPRPLVDVSKQNLTVIHLQIVLGELLNLPNSVPQPKSRVGTGRAMELKAELETALQNFLSNQVAEENLATRHRQIQLAIELKDKAHSELMEWERHNPICPTCGRSWEGEHPC